jgi:ABC-type hemin transport system ATPase subunit
MDGSLIVVEHNVPLISSLADRIVAMDLGRVIADGTPQQVLNDRHVVESYLGATAYNEIVGEMDDGKRPRRTRAVPRRKARKRSTRK